MGGSLGGMQALCWAIRYPRALRHALVIAAAPNLSAENIAFNEVARQAILTDPDFHDGHFDGGRHEAAPGPARRAHDRPHHLPVRRADGRQVRPPAARRPASSASRPSSRSSATCATRARSSPTTTTRTPTCASPRRSTTSTRRARPAATSPARSAPRVCKFLVVSFTTDWRFPPARSREIVKALVDNRRDVSYAEIDAPHGHDAFLLDDPQYHAVVGAYFDRIAHATSRTTRRSGSGQSIAKAVKERVALGRRARLRGDRQLDAGNGASVLDLGCGDGGLLAFLARERDVHRLRRRDRRRRRARERRRTASTSSSATSRAGSPASTTARSTS